MDNRSKSGFTIIELMITISIISILAAISIPGFYAYRPLHRARGTARLIFSDMHYAKMQSATQNIRYIVDFKAGTDEYRIYADKNKSGPELEADELVKSVCLKEIFPGIGIMYDRQINFLPKGTATSGTVSIRPLSDSGFKRRFKIIVSGTTGRIRSEQS